MKKKPEPHAEEVLDQWLERDLSAELDRLPRAFGVGSAVDDLAGILTSGRNVLLVGEAGVGKTALVYESIWALARTDFPAVGSLTPGTSGADSDATGDGLGLRLGTTRVVQLSVALRLSRLKRQNQIFEALATLMDALPRLEQPVIPFFRDGDLIYQLALAAQLETFCLRLPRPMIVEGRPGPMNAMLENYEQLEQHLVVVPVEEPDVERTTTCLTHWASARKLPPVHAEAVEEAVYLTHRFLARARLPRKAIDLLTNTTAGGDQVTADDVIERFCRVHHTPRWLVDPKLPLDIDALEERLRYALLGQDDAVSAALSAIALIKAGLSDMRRPFAVFLFVGPTGVGKTHLGKILAHELFGGAERMVRINMGDFASPRGPDALFGDPEHHLPANRRGVLTQRLMGRPFGVLLLDEFEKAHQTIHERMLPLIDEGEFVNGAGEKISCRSSLIIATSNAGAEVYRESALGFTTPADPDTKREELDRRIKETFRFELLNRFDRVVHFTPLTREEIRELAQRELASLQHRPGLRRRGARVQVEEAVIDWLADYGYDARYGARFLKRTIEREVTTSIADALARPSDPGQSTLELDVRRNRIRARFAPAPVSRSSPLSPTANAPHAGTEGLSSAALLERARPRLDELDAVVNERDRLLAEMAAVDFWDDEEGRVRVIERFRTLDVSARIAQRFARPITALREAVDERTEPSAMLLESAARSLREWEEREHLEGVRAVWLLLSVVDRELPPGDWLRDLARILMTWCRRVELRCTPVAFALRGGDVLTRLALEVEGPGAENYLESEQGVHRQRRTGVADTRVRVDLIPQGSDGLGVDVKDGPLTRGPFGLISEVGATLKLERTGQSMSLMGVSRATVAGLVGDLQAAWSSVRMDSPEVVRSYGEPGGVVIDPRTGASALQRSVSRGRLEPFQEAWRARNGA